jgi:CO/xanthine dehydrogenase Mo-binding subunit
MPFMMAAEELGVKASDVHFVSGDTQLTPFDLGAFASRTTYAAGKAVIMAAQEINKQLYKVAALQFGVSTEHLRSGDGMIYSIYEPKKKVEFMSVVANYIDAQGTLTATGHYSPPRKGVKGVAGANISQSPTFGFSA